VIRHVADTVSNEDQARQKVIVTTVVEYDLIPIGNGKYERGPDSYGSTRFKVVRVGSSPNGSVLSGAGSWPPPFSLDLPVPPSLSRTQSADCLGYGVKAPEPLARSASECGLVTDEPLALAESEFSMVPSITSFSKQHLLLVPSTFF